MESDSTILRGSKDTVLDTERNRLAIQTQHTQYVPSKQEMKLSKEFVVS